MATTLAQVLQRLGPQYLQQHSLSTAQARAWRAIVACRTPALGGQQLACEACGAPQWRWHSCRNRHCPQCQARARETWRAARLAELLEVPYCHLVFTLPHELNALAAVHARWVYDTLMRCAAATLSEFAANPRWLGGTGAFTLVLPDWAPHRAGQHYDVRLTAPDGYTASRSYSVASAPDGRSGTARGRRFPGQKRAAWPPGRARWMKAGA